MVIMMNIMNLRRMMILMIMRIRMITVNIVVKLKSADETFFLQLAAQLLRGE